MPTFRSRRVILPEGERPATVRFEEGRIVEVGDGPADLDFGDLAVLPGLVDSHVHVNEPGRTEWEGFATATAAAAAGGTTTIVDMPLNSIPPTVTEEALDEKRSVATGQVSVDVAFWGGIVPGSLPQASTLVDKGVCGFKVFTVDSGVEEFPPLDDTRMATAAAMLGGLGVPLVVHAEDEQSLLLPDGEPNRYATYLETRPPEAEATAIRRVAHLASAAGLDAHILHVSSAEAVDAIAGTTVTAETCPHYLTFDAAEIADGATAFKCAPPIRAREHRERLWEGLAHGELGMVVSDHSPAPPDVKALGTGDFLAAWGGIASVELRLLATWTGARRRGFDLPRVVPWLAKAPADLAGLAHRKGSIDVGWDADFVVFDPEGATEVDAANLHQRHPITPYHGLRLAGEVVATFLRGREIHGEGASPARLGTLLRRGE